MDGPSKGRVDRKRVNFRLMFRRAGFLPEAAATLGFRSLTAKPNRTAPPFDAATIEVFLEAHRTPPRQIILQRGHRRVSPGERSLARHFTGRPPVGGAQATAAGFLARNARSLAHGVQARHQFDHAKPM
jgi:hypothetical protein